MKNEVKIEEMKVSIQKQQSNNPLSFTKIKNKKIIFPLIKNESRDIQQSS